MKRCYHCKEIKPLSEFGKDRRNIDGISGICRTCKKLYNDAQKEYRKEYTKTHRRQADSPERKKIARAKYRALVYESSGDFSKHDITECLDYFSHECAYSGVPLTKGYSLDHVVPLSKGGANHIHNIVPCLDIVNICKATLDWESWYVEQSFYSEKRHEKIKQWMEGREA